MTMTINVVHCPERHRMETYIIFKLNQYIDAQDNVHDIRILLSLRVLVAYERIRVHDLCLSACIWIRMRCWFLTTLLLSSTHTINIACERDVYIKRAFILTVLAHWCGLLRLSLKSQTIAHDIRRCRCLVQNTTANIPCGMNHWRYLECNNKILL